MIKIFKFLGRLFFKITGYLPLRILLRQRYYKENHYKKGHSVKGGAILIANHTHIMDYFTMIFAHPFRKQRCLVSELIYQKPFLGFCSNVMDNILVHRERSDLSFMGEAENTLKKGGVITIFPEGHLVKTGKLDTFKPTVVYLALRSGAPIIPHYIEPHYFKSKRTRIIMGKPIYLRDYCDELNPSKEKVEELCQMLQRKVNELKRLLELYKRYHTQDTLSFHNAFYDFIKANMIIPTLIGFPAKIHYASGASKEDWKIKGRGLIVSKHFGFLDPPILLVHCFKRRCHIIIAQELYEKWPWFFKEALTIEYRRLESSSDPKCFLESINILKADGVVGIYPEGHLNPDGIGEIHDGAAYFALMSNSPIYFYYMLKPYKIFHRNHIMIGKTLYPEEVLGKNYVKSKENIATLTSIINQRFIDLQNEGKKYIEKRQKNVKK